MLTVRGVSLGIGKMNLSELEKMPKADRIKLEKLKREQKAEKQQQKKLIIRKRLDPKTLWSVCLTVIIGTIMMILALVMTVAGYFDSDYFVTEDSQNGNTSKDKEKTVGWFRFLLKSMQYVGPILMGLGMFLLIVACVITLESRDRHDQIGIAQEENNAELRRTRQSTIKRTRMSKNERSRANTYAVGDNLRQSQKERKIKENGTSTVERRNSAEIFVQAEIHIPPTSAPISRTTKINPVGEFSLSEEASSTDAMAEYTFRSKRGGLQKYGKNQNVEETTTINQRLHQLPIKVELNNNNIDVEKQQKLPKLYPNLKILNRRKSSTAIIHKNIPKGPAPLVRVESLIELTTTSGCSSPPPSNTTKNKK
uniref:Col_cuticle_N domain-containing protein n=1 Tax=Meloidogyne hapla TaxID=6305 RepID=A0A1I8BRG0_MELHA